MQTTISPNTLKLVFFHKDPKLLRRLVERPLAAQQVVFSCSVRAELIPLVAAAEPHLVVIAGDHDGVSPKEIELSLRNVGFHTRILVLPADCDDDRRLDAVWLTLRCFPRDPLCVQFDPERYVVLSSEDFTSTGSGSGAPPEQAARQEDRFLALLTTGLENHAGAQAYLSAVIATQRQYEREWISAALSGDALAYLWRRQLFRYVSTLAHYVPGVDTECLPLPHPPAEGLDYLPCRNSPEVFYALRALHEFGVNEGFLAGLGKMVQLQTRQDPQLPGEVAHLVGWAAQLREVAMVHIRVLDACFAERPAELTAFQNSRHSRNQQRIFCQWWRLTHFIDSPGEILRLVKEFRSGRRPSAISRICSFYQFLRRFEGEDQAASLPETEAGTASSAPERRA